MRIEEPNRATPDLGLQGDGVENAELFGLDCVVAWNSDGPTAVFVGDEDIDILPILTEAQLENVTEAISQWEADSDEA